MSVASRIRVLVERRRAERELEDELRFHLEQQVEEHVAAGMPRAEAERAARQMLGGLAQVQEECRDARGWGCLVDAARDARYAVRTLGRSPGFAAAAIVTLALGIGANTAVFSIADAVLLKLLPVRDPRGLVQFLQPNLMHGQDYAGFSFVNYRELQSAAAGLLDVGGDSQPYQTQAVVDNAREPVRRSLVSGTYFTLLASGQRRGACSSRPSTTKPAATPKPFSAMDSGSAVSIATQPPSAATFASATRRSKSSVWPNRGSPDCRWAP